MRVFWIDWGYTISAPAVRGKCFGGGCGDRWIVVFGWDQSPGTGRAEPPATSTSRRQRDAGTGLPEHAHHFVDNAKSRGGNEERAIPGGTLLPYQRSSFAAAAAARPKRRHSRVAGIFL